MKQSSVKNNTQLANLKVGCLFCGIGGFAKGFENQGFQIEWGLDKDPEACATFKHNFPRATVLNENIENLAKNPNILEQIDILTAGFPCQPFSNAGQKKKFNDPRSQSFFQMMDFIKGQAERKPKVLVLENVKQIKTADNGAILSKILRELLSAGYCADERNAFVLEAALTTGVPQFRERCFIVALESRYALGNNFKIPEPTSRPIFEIFSKCFVNTLQKKEKRFYFHSKSKYLKLFKSEYEKARSDNSQNSIYLLRRTYVRRNKSRLCFTLVASMGIGGHNVPVVKDKWGFRKLTVDECARLQGWYNSKLHFPQSLSERSKYRMLGNSVVVQVVEKIACSVKSMFANYNNPTKRLINIST
jgi:DNA (cytosine-5)-methyltransferase 1